MCYILKTREKKNLEQNVSVNIYLSKTNNWNTKCRHMFKDNNKDTKTTLLTIFDFLVFIDLNIPGG